LTAEIQKATGDTVEIAFVDQGYTGDRPAADAAAHGIQLEVVKEILSNVVDRDAISDECLGSEYEQLLRFEVTL
jgi:basic membrane lipoprotein Med (substrate-binding protein (PBP1-ABC) superfamily)